MPLQFPNARLFVHELLSDRHMTGAEAIVSSAYEFGLLPAGILKEVEFSSTRDQCDCCGAALAVFKKHVELLDHGSIYDSAKVESAWNSIISRVKKYTASETAAPASQNCPAACSKLAPVLFDLLLQEVRRYC